MKRCEELQSKERADNQAKEDDRGETKQAFVEKLQRQLDAKNAKLQRLNNVVLQLERKIASLTRANAMEGQFSPVQEQMNKQHIKQLVEKISSLKHQRHQLRCEVQRCREHKLGYQAQMKEMEEELQRERERMQSLNEQLARYKRRGESSSCSSSSRKSSKAKLDGHVRHLKEKLARVEQQVRDMSREKEGLKKEFRDEVTDVEADFLGVLESSSNMSTGRRTAPWGDDDDPEGEFLRAGKDADGQMLRRNKQSLEGRLLQYEEDLKSSEMRRRNSEQAVLELNDEIRKLRDPQSIEECSRIARLVSAMEELEAENRDLRRLIAVDKEEQISKLEEELKRLSGAQGKRPSGSPIVASAVSSEIEEMEQVVAGKDRLILELKFEHDQAMRRVAEVETRFEILFREWVEENSRRVPGWKPIIGPLPKAGSRKNTGGEGTGKENELQLLVFTMKRVVDKLRAENSKLKKAGLSESRYQKLLKRNQELKSTIDALDFKIDSYGKASPQGIVPILEKKIEELTEDVHTLTDVNTEMIHVLRQAEDVYPDLKAKIRKKTGTPFQGVKYFADVSRHESVVKKQGKEMARIQEELNKMVQLNNDLIYQVAKREDELDLLHGKLYVRDLIGTEGVRKKIGEARDSKELNSHATTVINNGCFEVLPGDYRKGLETFDARLVDEIEELRIKHHNLTEVCKHYEQLLFKYTGQLNVPFKPLTEV